MPDFIPSRELHEKIRTLDMEKLKDVPFLSEEKKKYILLRCARFLGAIEAYNSGKKNKFRLFQGRALLKGLWSSLPISISGQDKVLTQQDVPLTQGRQQPLEIPDIPTENAHRTELAEQELDTAIKYIKNFGSRSYSQDTLATALKITGMKKDTMRSISQDIQRIRNTELFNQNAEEIEASIKTLQDANNTFRILTKAIEERATQVEPSSSRKNW